MLDKIIKCPSLSLLVLCFSLSSVQAETSYYNTPLPEMERFISPNDTPEINAENLYQATYKFSDNFLDDDSFQKIATIRQAARLGGHVSQSLLGDIYFDGDLVEQNFDLAISWYLIAANNGSAYAKYTLSELYKYGIVLPEAINYAIAWRQAGDETENNTSGLHRLAERYTDLDTPLYNEVRAKFWYERAAVAGDVRAQTVLAEIYYASNVAMDDIKALRWNARAAYNNSPEGQFNLARMYYHGRFLGKSYDEAFHWMQKSALQGYRPAQYELGMMFLEGRGVNPDRVLAYAWLMAANPELSKYQYVNELAIKAAEMLPVDMSDSDMEAAARLAYKFKRRYLQSQ